MNLVIDIGNTQTKVAVFDHSVIIDLIHYDYFSCDRAQLLLEKHAQVNLGIISCVGKKDQESFSFLGKQLKNLMELTGFTPVPFENLYESKETLGVDRIAAIAGAQSLFPDSDVLVIDAGSAITYEFINNKSQYLGGNISPGLQMRFKSLNYYTNRLPLVKPSDDYQLLGNNTGSAIVAGVQNGILFEIEGVIKKLFDQYPDLKIILTGGDAEFFAKKLKYSIFVNSNIVLIGLNRILDFNT